MTRNGLLALALILVAACGSRGSRGAKAMGDPCAHDDECTHGLCVAGVAGRDGRCTVSCATQDECPRGWSCSAATTRGVVVCSRHAATPFGSGNEH